MIKIATRIALEVIVNGQINILTQTLSHMFTLNKFFHSCSTFFDFFPSLTTLAFYHSTFPYELLKTFRVDYTRQDTTMD